MQKQCKKATDQPPRDFLLNGQICMDDGQFGQEEWVPSTLRFCSEPKEDDSRAKKPARQKRRRSIVVDQISIDDWWASVLTNRKDRRWFRQRNRAGVSKMDIEYIRFAMDQHMSFIKDRKIKAASWENTPEKEYVRSLTAMNGLKSGTLTKEDFWFVEFVLTEHGDYLLEEKIGESWFDNPAFENRRNSLIIANMKKAIGMSDEEYEFGPA